jgi:uncharacterized damage-inducible protein DinB
MSSVPSDGVESATTNNRNNACEDSSMLVKELELRFNYGYWANRKLFEVLPQLTVEQFTQPVADNHGSIRNTLVHILSAEWG